MSLFPFYRYRFFDDFFFSDPWFDFDLFPPFDPPVSQYRWFKHKERLSYASTNMKNNSRSLEQLPQVTQPSPPEKFRVQLSIDGFNPDRITKRIEGRKLIVEGRQEDRREERNYTRREIRETYELPEHTDPNGLNSYVTSGNNLVIEVPYQNSQSNRQLEPRKCNSRSSTQLDQYRDPSFDNIGLIDGSALQPRIVDKGHNQKQLEVIVDVKNYRPEELNVSVRNNELIVQGKHQQTDQNASERSFFLKSTTLPRGTQIDQLQSHLDDNGQLKIEGPVLS